MYSGVHVPSNDFSVKRQKTGRKNPNSADSPIILYFQTNKLYKIVKKIRKKQDFREISSILFFQKNCPK
jgi:hypothetical protein